MLGVVLAGGKGRRLQPITSSRPKALVPVLGKPIIVKVLESLAGMGVDEFLIVVNPNDEQTPNILASQSGLNIKINTVFQHEPLGMGNALHCAADHIRDDFILSACDNIVSHDDLQVMLAEWQRSEDIAGVLSLIPVQPQEIVELIDHHDISVSKYDRVITDVFRVGAVCPFMNHVAIHIHEEDFRLDRRAVDVESWVGLTLHMQKDTLGPARHSVFRYHCVRHGPQPLQPPVSCAPGILGCLARSQRQPGKEDKGNRSCQEQGQDVLGALHLSKDPVCQEWVARVSRRSSNLSS